MASSSTPGSIRIARGAYSYVCVGGAGAPATLARPIAETLFFAGEHTQAQGEWASVHGAIASGHRVVDEIASAFDE